MTRLDLGLIAQNLLILTLGYALLYALGFARIRRADLLLVGIAYLGGWALLGTVLSLALMAGVHSGVLSTVVVVAVLVALLAFAGRRVGDARPARVPQGRHPLGLLAVALAAVIVVAD